MATEKAGDEPEQEDDLQRAQVHALLAIAHSIREATMVLARTN